MFFDNFAQKIALVCAIIWAWPLAAQPTLVNTPWGDAAPQRLAYSPSGSLWVVVGKQVYYQKEPGGAFMQVPGEINQRWFYRNSNAGLIRTTSFSPEDGRLYTGQLKQPDTLTSGTTVYWEMLTEISARGINMLCDQKSYTFDGVLGNSKSIGSLVGPWSSDDGKYYMAGILGQTSTIFAAEKGSCNFKSVVSSFPGQIVQAWRMGDGHFVVERTVSVADSTNPITDVVEVKAGNVRTLASPNLSTNPMISGRANTPCTLAADGFAKTALVACAGTDWDAHALFIKSGVVRPIYDTVSDFALKTTIRAISVSGDELLLGGDDYQPYVMFTLLAINAGSGKHTVAGHIRRLGDMVGPIAPTQFFANMAAINQSGTVGFAAYDYKVSSSCKLLELKTLIKPTAKISVDKTEINPGDDVKVSWSTQGADVVTVGGYGPVSASGSMTVKPSETTSYTLTASNSLGVEISTVTVTVVPKKLPPPRSASGRGEGGDFPRPSHRER